MGIAIEKLQYSGYTEFELFELFHKVAKWVGSEEHLDIVDVPKLLTDLAAKRHLPRYLTDVIYIRSALEILLPHWKHLKAING